MAQVQTVRGPVPVEALGTVLMHEHVFVLNEEIRRNYPELWDEEGQVAGAISRLLTPGAERVMVAVAEAHKRTGVPITVHTSPGHRTGLVAQDILRREGVDLGRVVMGHSGDTSDLDYLHRLIDGGSYLGMDRFGLDALLPGDQRIATVVKLASEGLADRMVLAPGRGVSYRLVPSGSARAGRPELALHAHPRRRAAEAARGGRQ